MDEEDQDLDEEYPQPHELEDPWVVPAPLVIERPRLHWAASIAVFLLAIAGLAMLWILVNRILDEVRGDEETTTAAPTTTIAPTDTSTTTTTSTTVPTDPVVVAYADEVSAIATQAEVLAENAGRWNEAQDNDTEEFGTVRDELQRIIDNTTELRLDLETVVPPPILITQHDEITTLLDELVAAAEGMLEGLRRPSPDTGEFRREQLGVYQAKSAELTVVVAGLAS